MEVAPPTSCQLRRYLNSRGKLSDGWDEEHSRSRVGQQPLSERAACLRAS